MSEEQRRPIIREEIIKYVDELVKKYEDSYDKRIIPMLYEFFIRSAEKFNWDKDTFLNRYENFSESVKNIEFGKLPKSINGIAKKDRIIINKNYIAKLKRGKGYNKFISIFNHECLHQLNEGLYKISEGKYINRCGNINLDTILDELGNSCAEYIISSEDIIDETMMPFYINLNSYGVYKQALSIMCATFDISEIEFGLLKDKGRRALDEYLKNKYPYIDIDAVLDSIAISLNVIHNTNIHNVDNMELPYECLLNISNYVIHERICNAFLQEVDIEEFIERMFFDINKIKMSAMKTEFDYYMPEMALRNSMNRLQENVQNLGFYRKFSYFKNQYEPQVAEKILQDVRDKRSINVELIKSGFQAEYEEKRYYIEEIINKYYASSKEPLNDNTELIAQLKKNFMKTTIIEKIANSFKSFGSSAIERISILFGSKKVKELPNGELKGEEENFIEEIRYEGTIKTPDIEVGQENDQSEIQMNYGERED